MLDVKTIAYSILLILSFLFGYQYSNNKCSYTLKDIENKANELTVKGLQEQIDKAQEQQSLVLESEKKANDGAEKVQENFSLLANSDMFIFDWLHTNSTDKTSKDLHPYTASTDNTKKEAQCRCPKDYREEFQRVQRLYSKELEKAKECDLVVVQLNELIDFYEKLQNNFTERK